MVTIRLTDREAKLIRQWLGCQDWDDTNNIIFNYGLDIDTQETDDALYRLFKQIPRED